MSYIRVIVLEIEIPTLHDRVIVVQQTWEGRVTIRHCLITVTGNVQGGLLSVAQLFSLIFKSCSVCHFLINQMYDSCLEILNRCSFFNHITSILKTFKACVDGGKEATAPQWQRNLKTDWWNKIVPYFLHACLWGSLDAVKYFIDSRQKPNVR